MAGQANTSLAEQKPQAGSLHISTSALGIAIPFFYGRVRLPGNLIWASNIRSVESKGQSAGKGGQGRAGGGTYDYFIDCQFGICEGPILAIPKMWVAKNVYRYVSDLDNTMIGGWKLGTYSQEPLSWMASGDYFTAGYGLKYRGLAYWGMQDLPLGGSPNMPDMSFELRSEFEHSSAGDALASDIIEDMLTNAHYGAGVDAARLGDLTELETYTRAAGLFFSPVYDSQQEAFKHVEDLLKLCNCAPYWSEGTLKIRSYGDEEITGDSVTYTPDLTPIYDLTDDDFIVGGDDDPITVTRSAQSDAYNAVKLEFKARTKDYNTASVHAKDQANIEEFGLREMAVVTAHPICNQAVATRSAQHLLQRALYVRNTYEFTLGWRHCLLEPMDLVTLTDAALGLDQALVRILEISEDEDGALSVVAEEVVGGTASPALFETEDFDQGMDPNTATTAASVNDPIIFEAPATLTGGKLELWMGLSASDAGWGGCDIYVSTDGGTSYTLAKSFRGKSRTGTTTATFASGSDPDTTNTLAVDLSESDGALDAGTTGDADAANTLCYVGGELVAYSDATLTGAHTYDLDAYIRRGMFGTAIASHGSGAQFARVDSGVARYPYTADRLGTTLYFKFASVNIYGTWVQDLADCTAYTYTLAGYGAAPPTGLAGAGQALAVDYTWTNPPVSGGFALAELWISATNDRTTAALAWSGSASRATIPETAGTYYAWVRAQNAAGNYSAWEPSGSTSGVSATAAAASGGTSTGTGGGYDPAATGDDVLMHMEASGFPDVNGHTVSNSGVSLTGACKWGDWGAGFGGADYLTVAGSWSGTQFTVECWVTFSADSSHNGHDMPFLSVGGLGLRRDATGGALRLYNGSTDLGGGGTVITRGLTYYYVAMTFNAGAVTVYLNGASQITASVSGTYSATTLYIGKDESSYIYFHGGNIDEYRFSPDQLRTVTATPTGPFGDYGPPDYSGVYEPAIALGATSQYWRGDKSWQTLDKGAIGLGNVENTALSTWAGSANIATLGTVTAGVWHGSTIGAAYLPAMGASGGSHAAGLVPDPGGTSGTTKYLREDGTWQVPPGTGGGLTTRTGVVRAQWISAGAMMARTTNGATARSAETTTYLINYDYFEFGTATTTYVQFGWALPDEWDRGTVKVKLYWVPATGSSGTLAMRIHMRGFGDNVTLDASLGAGTTINDTAQTAGNLHVTPAVSFTANPTGTALDDLVIFEIYRDTAFDSVSGNVRLLGILLQYIEDSTEPSAW